jgi:hypothetical protein
LTIDSRYPPKIFLFMLDIANKYGIPVKRVETILLQKAIQPLGFSCSHVPLGMRKSDKKPFCKDCWTIFRQVKAPRYSYDGTLTEAGQYVREPTFLDEQGKDKQQHEEKEDKQQQQDEILKLTGPRRKYSPRFKTVNQIPHMQD